MSKRAPRLQFTDEELAAPEISKAAKKAAKRIEKLERLEAKIPVKNGAEKPHPTSKLQHAVRDAPGAVVRSAAHREVAQHEDDNVGVESAHHLEQAAENSVHFIEAAHRSHQLKPYRNADRAESRADSANLDALQKQAQRQNPELQSNPYSRWQQKRAIKKEYAAAKASGGTVSASEVTAKAAKRATEDTKKVSEWITEHRKGFLIALAILLVAVFLLNIASSCSVLVEGGVTALGVSTYPSEDSDMLAAEAQYCAMEAELQSKLDNYEATHDYDEYHFELDEIGHAEQADTTCICTTHCEVGAINTDCPVCKASMPDCMGKTQTVQKDPEPIADSKSEAVTDTKADSAQKKSNAPLILLLLVLLGGGFALYWFKLRKPKPDTKGSADLDDYDFGEEDDEPEETVDEDESV